MEQHDIEIEIAANGEVKVHVKGVKGPRCMSYVEFLSEVVGPVKQKQLTHEYYEPDSKVRIDLEDQQHVRDADS